MRRILGFALLCAPVLAPAAEAPALDPHFAPIAFLVGDCWRAEFSATMHDEQCFAPMYDGKLVHNTHRVVGSDPLYQGTTWFSWDAKHERVRFHYFTSTGAVSEGHLVAADDGYVIPERHVGNDGVVTEMENAFVRDGDDGYRVVVRQKIDGEWKQIGNRSYRRLAPPHDAGPAVDDGR
jgi:hypothetical protein